MMKRLPLAAAALGAVLLLTTGCGRVGTPTASPTSAGPPSPTPTTISSPAPTTGPPVLTAGDCTEAEMTDAQPTVYTVYTGDSTNPVTIHYTAFNHDGTNPTDTLTTVGPVITIVGYACTEAAGEATWVLTATHSIVGSIGCVLDFGGLLVATDSKGQEDAGVTIDCSGNPGE
jgi:hypothetical protein